MKGPSPLLGYNNNVRHKGRVFHIQTEDSGIRHPHVITHLFMDGGRILKTQKTSYAQHLEDENGHEHVRALMKQQHQAMFRDLRDGKFDYALAPVGAPAAASGAPASSSSPASASSPASSPSPATDGGPSSVAPVSLPPASFLSPATSSDTIPVQAAPPAAPPSHDEPPVTVEARRLLDVQAPALTAIPVPLHRVTDPSAQTMPDLRAVRAEDPQRGRSSSAPAPAPEQPAVAFDADAPESSTGDQAAFDAIEDYDPSSSASRSTTPVPSAGLPLPPPPLAMLTKVRPDGVYRSHGTPLPPAPAPGAVGSGLAGRSNVGPRPPVGPAVGPSARPQPRRSLFGEDYVSEKSLDEVILSYLAEDLDADK